MSFIERFFSIVCFIRRFYCIHYPPPPPPPPPPQYDVNKDGILEFLLTTSDGEILFLHTNNSLLHGETIKVKVILSPLNLPTILAFKKIH